MKHRTRISRLRRLLMARHVVYPPCVVHCVDDAGEITKTFTTHMRFTPCAAS